MSTPEETATLYRTIEGMMDESRMFNFALLAICIWEAFITFPTEYRFMWRKSVGLLDAAYFAVRYGVIIQLAVVEYLLYWPHSFESCTHVYRFEFTYPPLMYMLGGAIMTMRTYALWNKDRIVLGVLATLVVLQGAIQFWNPHTGTAVQMPPGINGCIGGGFQNYWVFWICPLILDSVVLGLTFYKSAKKWQAGARSPLVVVLMRDQAMLYALGFTAALANVIHHVLTPETGNKVLLCPLACAMQGIAVCRVVLNVRSTAAAARTMGPATGNSFVRNVIQLNTITSTPNSTRHSKVGKLNNTAVSQSSCPDIEKA